MSMRRSSCNAFKPAMTARRNKPAPSWHPRRVAPRAGPWPMTFSRTAGPSPICVSLSTFCTSATCSWRKPLLRLEFLYTQATYHSESSNPWNSRAAISSLLEILAITARGDSRSDVLKELERQVNVLKEYQTKTGVDPGRLKSLMSNLVKLRNELSSIGGNYMAPLRDSEFLSAVKHRSAIPGGTCDFDLPDYSYWLSRPAEIRAAEFANWLAYIRPLCDSIAELLWLTRQNTKRKSEVAVGGIFQLQFDRENPCQLVRVTLPAGLQLYPEMSGSQHRCTIRFLNWLDATTRPVHVETDVPFLLTCCA